MVFLNKFKVFALIFVLFVTFTAAGELIEPGRDGVLVLEGDKKEKPSRLYVPSDYTPGKKWPLIISMHGRGGSPDINPWKGILQGKGYFIAGLNFAHFPLRDSGERKGDYPNSTQNNVVVRKFFLQAIDKVAQDYNIDRDHIIYGGNSMGGWMCSPLCFYPDFVDTFRGFIIWGCGTAPDNDAKFSVGKGKPIMVFHGETCFNKKLGDRFLPNVEKAGFIVSREIIEGQGHCPSASASREVIGGWFASLRKEDRLLRGVCPLEWQEAKLEGVPAGKKTEEISSYVKEQEFFKNRSEDKPMLVWCFSNSSVKKKGKPAKLSKAAIKCEKAYNAAFKYPGSKKTLPAATKFQCVSIDLTQLDKKDNPVFNSDSAPLVVLVSKDGETISLIKGSVSDSSLAGKMKALLSDEEKKDVASAAKDSSKVQKSWKKLQKKFFKEQKKLVDGFCKGLKHNDKNILGQKEKLAEILVKHQKIIDGLKGTEQNED